MMKRWLNTVGWLLIFLYFVLWFGFGYLEWQWVLAPVAILCFWIKDGYLKKLRKNLLSSKRKGALIFATYILAIATVFVLLQLANYIINDIFHLKGWVKTSSQFIAVILALYPVKFTFGSIVYNLNEKEPPSTACKSDNKI